MIIGAAIIGGIGSFLGDDKKRQPSSSVLRRTPNKAEQPKLPSIDSDSEFSEWRNEWEPIVNWSEWIPKNLASEIAQEFPPYENGGSLEKPNASQGASIALDIIASSRLNRCEEALRLEFVRHNSSFLISQKEKLIDFFSSVESNPLTDEQMDCCICMDDAVQIVAAAGSGKTSTIVARVGYALKEGLAQPEEILILAFNKSVKVELEARIKERLSDVENVERINVMTFNAFGLEVIGKSTRRKPRLADWVESSRDVQAISDIVEDLRQRDPRFRLDWDMFRTVYGRDIGEWESIKQPRSDATGQGSIQTADGKYVKSQEERMICDFLFYHGVQYEYERPYEHDTVTEEYSQYHPDFYYPRIRLYHEHFALNEEEKAPTHFSVDYVSGVQWKRTLHDEKETQLFETTSHGLRNGDDIDRLRLELEQHGEILEFDVSRPSPGQKPIPTKQLASTIRAFQQHVKSNGLSHQDLHNSITKLERSHRERLSRFVRLYERVADEWQRRLKSEESVDFDDMLLAAIHHIESGTFKSPYKMVLADEFQDVSQAKLRLLKALKESAESSLNLCVVGDDWQGINRFAGADITVMTGFEKTFPSATQLTLSKTFRCPQVLCDASSEFIQKNPKQIKKTVESTNNYKTPPLHVFAAETVSSAMDCLERHLKQLFVAAKTGDLDMQNGKKVTVMLVGRYHKDKPTSLNAWQRTFGDQLDLSFSTAHASKGLEADYVMLLNVTEGLMGFPSQIVDDPVLQLAMPEPDDFPLAEERRLFYVALTRARRQTRVYTLQDKPSRFVIELAKDGYTEIKNDTTTLKICPKCGNGTLSQKSGRYGPFEACSAHPECDYTKGLLSFSSSKAASVQSVRLKEPVTEGTTCPTCSQGTMVVRSGQNNQPFLGCSSFPKCRTTASRDAIENANRSN
ncbi:UvrD/REP helicase [Sulfitobacter geojensis]|nr:UvrD/REP helicase [Sulfitobacter geojensis]